MDQTTAVKIQSVPTLLEASLANVLKDLQVMVNLVQVSDFVIFSYGFLRDRLLYAYDLN